MYGPQPLLPFFAQEFGVTEAQSALLITVTLLPLGFAPLSYGYILQAVSSVKLLRWSILALALTMMAFAGAGVFGVMVGVRFGQGLILPAAMTSLMTYISASTERAYLQRLMSFYIAATIAGGYLGRLLAGLSATYLTWQFFYYALAVLLLICFVALNKLPTQTQVKLARPSPQALWHTLTQGTYLTLYLIIFCTFFVFAGLLNFLPFRLADLWGQPSGLATSFMYTGYLVGIAVSLGSGRIIRFLHGQPNAIRLAFAVYGLALGLMLLPNTVILFVALLGFCGAMFLVHSVATGLANQMATDNQGLVNGLYVAFYYSGGVLGSYLPGLVYQRFGWTALIVVLMMVVGVGIVLTLGRGLDIQRNS